MDDDIVYKLYYGHDHSYVEHFKTFDEMSKRAYDVAGPNGFHLSVKSAEGVWITENAWIMT